MSDFTISRRQLLAGTAALGVTGPALAQPTADDQLLALFDAIFAEGIADPLNGPPRWGSTPAPTPA